LLLLDFYSSVATPVLFAAAVTMSCFFVSSTVTLFAAYTIFVASSAPALSEFFPLGMFYFFPWLLSLRNPTVFFSLRPPPFPSSPLLFVGSAGEVFSSRRPPWVRLPLSKRWSIWYPSLVGSHQVRLRPPPMLFRGPRYNFTSAIKYGVRKYLLTSHIFKRGFLLS
jgi:hypothetical protein